MRAFFAKQIEEVRENLELRALGAGLAVTHLLTYIRWFLGDQDVYASTNNTSPICWPWFPHCESAKILSVEQIKLFGDLYASLAVAAGLCFIFRASVKYGYSLIALLLGMKLFVFWQDYRYMGNYHYMTFLVSLVFLFVPRKTWTLKRLIVGFYFFAGTLKLNHEWLSGAALPDQWIHPETPPFWLREHGFIPLCCSYVVLLELVFVFGLLSRNRIIFLATFFQFLAFHVFSYWIVSWFYPLTMFCILGIFPIKVFIKGTRFEGAGKAKENGSPLWPGYAVLACYALAQVVPWTIPGDSSLTGEGRMLALNMFDSLSMCHSKSLARFNNRNIDVSFSPKEVVGGVRIQCDPYLFFSRAKAICRALKDEPGFVGVSLSLISKRTSDEKFREIISEDNFCRDEIKYSVMTANHWIHNAPEQ